MKLKNKSISSFLPFDRPQLEAQKCVDRSKWSGANGKVEVENKCKCIWLQSL